MPILGVIASGISGHLTPPWPDNSYYQIATTTVGAGGTSTYVEFTSIPSTYTHLQIRALYGTNSANSTSIMRINSDTSSVYAYHYMTTTNSSVVTGASINRDLGHLTDFNGGALNSGPSVAIIDYLDYANANKFKTVRILQGYDANGSGAVNIESNLWRSTSAITSIQIYAPGGGSIVQNSQFALYGVKV